MKKKIINTKLQALSEKAINNVDSAYALGILYAMDKRDINKELPKKDMVVLVFDKENNIAIYKFTNDMPEKWHAIAGYLPHEILKWQPIYMTDL